MQPFEFIIAAADGSASILQGPVPPALISAAVTAFGAWLMFRGKTQDTANWLIQALRTDAESARTAAIEAVTRTKECEAHRESDQRIIKGLLERVDRLEAQVAGHHPID